ncbi:MAG: NADH:flavin oxidoreductase [Mucilaginibacter polytrichastri]|nr:NADH:flavin oxidoreductase [Mucilaginibacter polytrichastri]
MNTSSLFQPFALKSLHIKNRFVMAPMTRAFSPGGVPTDEVAKYYAKRAAGEVGLILSEGTVIERVASSNDPGIPHFYGDKALAGWKNVIENVHLKEGKMGPQIWHMGISTNHQSGWVPDAPFEGPSDKQYAGFSNGKAMTDADVADAIAAYGRAAGDAKRLGFDTVELHGAHGYLIDQFFWDQTNDRSDLFGGKTLPERSRFAIEVIREVRRQVGEDFPVIIRLSQWKPTDYNYKMAANPAELEAWLNPLAEAGIDIFHGSQRRFWEPEFEGSDLNFAGWIKKVTGKATITVGSVGLNGDFMGAFRGHSSSPASLDDLVRRFDRGDFDLVAVGRPLLADPNWVQKIHADRSEELTGFTKEALAELV